MKSAKLSMSVPGEWSRRGLVALLLTGALLVCHGAYGASHQILAAMPTEYSSDLYTIHANIRGAGAIEHPMEHQGGNGRVHL